MGQMKLAEVAERLGVSQDTVRRLVKSGELRAFTKLGQGRAYFFERGDVEKLAKSLTVEVKPKGK